MATKQTQQPHGLPTGTLVEYHPNWQRLICLSTMFNTWIRLLLPPRGLECGSISWTVFVYVLTQTLYLQVLHSITFLSPTLLEKPI